MTVDEVKWHERVDMIDQHQSTNPCSDRGGIRIQKSKLRKQATAPRSAGSGVNIERSIQSWADSRDEQWDNDTKPQAAAND